MSTRSLATRLGRSPGAQLVVGAALLAIAFPASTAGSLGLAVLAGALGVAAALAWPHAPAWLRSPPERITGTLVICIVVMVGVGVFRDVLTESPDWQMGDWGPQRAVLAHVMPALPGTDLPVWNQVISTGDAPLELYPSLAYVVTGYVALALGGDLSLALMIVAVLVHLTIAAATTAIAAQLAPKPIALLIGVATLVDSGAVAHGGTVGLFRWALLHSAFALACATLAAVGVISALRRPRLAASATIWLATAIATVAHPAGLIAAAATMVALAVVALLASDLPARRPLAALLHVALGVALGASLWMSLAARILAYGQHFPNALRSPARLLEDLLQYPSPNTAFAALEYVGYFGILVALWSRRAVAVFVAAAAFVLLLGLCDAPYLALDLAPGYGVARLGTERLAALARPFVWAASAYGLAIFWAHARAGWLGATRRRQLIAAAVIGVIAGAALRAIPGVWTSASDRAANEARVIAGDPVGRAALTHWATERVQELKPGAWARALFEEDTHEHFHLTAETGLPSFHLAPQPDMLLRERIEDTSAASLARFNVRWVIGVGKSPSLGDPASEKQFGSYRVRELTTWDGKFARIERGTGEVTVTRLDDRGVELDVRASAPVLVALGTGFYPRWQAHHASGAVEPVYAYPDDPRRPAPRRGRVARARPHDVHDRRPAALGSRRRRDRRARARRHRRHRRDLDPAALAPACAAQPDPATRSRHPARASRALQIAVPLTILALVLRGCHDDARVTRALVLGTGVRPIASVEARLAGDAWQACAYLRVTGAYDCDGLVTATDGMASLLTDAPPSWGFNTPAIVASPYTTGVEIRIRLAARLAGTYDAAASDPSQLAIDGEPSQPLERAELSYADHGERTVEIRATVPTSGWSFTFVRQDTIVPPRPFLAGPPTEPPPAVQAIR